MTNEKMSGEAMAAKLVEAIAEKSFGGRLPNAPTAICLAVARVCLPDEHDEDTLAAYFAVLMPAVQARIAAQNARWLA